MTAKFELFKDAAGKFRFHLKAANANGEIIAASQGYTSKATAQTGIASIKDNAASAPTEDLT
ncbi:YegP family protein [Rhodococcus koreensis]|uniref:YegP family protein n=1 Tax=Rhodococcus koreensis TaxID=99653 RepID=UPI0036721CE6